MMKSAILLLGLMSLVLVAGCLQGPTGEVVFAITDAAADMGSVTSVNVTVESVRVHSNATGWVTVMTGPKTYDLLQLKNEDNTVLLSDVQLGEGLYEQIRLVISKVAVTDSNGTHDAKLPSTELKLVGIFSVAANTTSAVVFDFIADESLHVTGNGQYIMAPVIQLNVRENATVEVEGDDVTVEGGNVHAQEKQGMDINGNTGPGKGIPRDAVLELSNGNARIKNTGP